jgi:hypothetical protein
MRTGWSRSGREGDKNVGLRDAGVRLATEKEQQRRRRVDDEELVSLSNPTVAAIRRTAHLAGTATNPFNYSSYLK